MACQALEKPPSGIRVVQCGWTESGIHTKIERERERERESDRQRNIRKLSLIILNYFADGSRNQS